MHLPIEPNLHLDPSIHAAPFKLAPSNEAFVIFAPIKFASNKLLSLKLASISEDPLKFTLVRLALVKFDFSKFPPSKFASYKLALKNLPTLHNIYPIGTRLRDDLPAYLQYAQVGIIPFNLKKYPTLLNPVRPLKLLEYLSAGLPCISVAWKELEHMNAPIKLAYSNEEFIEALPKLCFAPSDKDLLKRYARDYDWDIIFSDFLEQVLTPRL